MWQKEEVRVQGYHTAVNKSRAEGVKGGGVILLIKDHLKVGECNVLNDVKFEESAWCIVNTSQAHRLLVGICYRAPNSSSENNQELLKLMDLTKTVNATDYLIMGDFNFCEINWVDGIVAGPIDSEAAQFFHKVQDCYFCQHVNFQTRYRDGVTPSTLDLIFTDQENNVELKCEAPLGKSDHRVITRDHRIQTQHQDVGDDPHRLNYRAANYDAINQELSKVEWDIIKDKNIEEAWSFFCDKLQDCTKKNMSP